MPRTMLVGAQTGVWREWLRSPQAPAAHLCLDPASCEHGPAARLTLTQGERTLGWRFFGHLGARRAPHSLFAGLEALLEKAPEDVAVELPPHRPNPLGVHLSRLLAERIRPDRILFDPRANLNERGWPAPLQEGPAGEAPPPAVEVGRRKARWLQMLEECEAHEVDLRQTPLIGLRLGTGEAIPPENLRKWGFEAARHAEWAERSLLVVTDEDPDELPVTRALDATHTERAHIVSTRTYENLLCSFARETGEDFGMGRIERVDFERFVAEVYCTAVPPAPLATLRVGWLRVDRDGQEQGELRPWGA
jgi:hypothetical protein